MAAVTLGQPRAIARRAKARLKANIRGQWSWPAAQPQPEGCATGGAGRPCGTAFRLWLCSSGAIGLAFGVLAFLLSTHHLDAAARKPPKQSAADSQKLSATKDQCAPEPGDTAPPLPAKILDGQGHVHFPITTASAEAQQYFDQGVAQMHSFWAREAERSFLQAAELDPSAPMPWWGVAMVAAGDYRPGFQLEFVNGVPTEAGKDAPKPTSDLHGGALRAREAAQRAVELSKTAGKASPLEKLYIRAVAARPGGSISGRSRSENLSGVDSDERFHNA